MGADLLSMVLKLSEVNIFICLPHPCYMQMLCHLSNIC